MKIGFIGLGIMGESMSENIVNKHNDSVFVFDIVKEQVDLLVSKGAIGCENANEVCKNADIIISMVPTSKHVQTLYESILEDLDSSKFCIDMSTIDPAVSIEVSKLVKARGSEFIDAPVVKSKPAAISGTLGIYVGGTEEAYQKARDILLYMGNNVVRMGENGKGLVMKICHNALVSQIQNGVNETVTLAAKNGINILEYAQAISYGGGQNFYLDGKAKPISEENFSVAFSVENMAKDVNICINLAEESGVNMPSQHTVKKVYDQALEKGLAKEDFSATIKVVRES